jgi:tetratricopeptide (TPR) repeat protein
MQQPNRNAAIILADFQNRTHDTVFDHTLDDVLRADLGQSPFVTVIPDKEARDILALMKQPANAILTPNLAEEVCERANADTVLDSALDAVGAHYILTLTASDCSGRRVFATVKADAMGRDAVVPALDRLIGGLRHRLGESAGSIDRFNVPLAPEKTASLDALKAYSEGLWLSEHGRRQEAIPNFKHALDLDPGFAAPYVSLAAIYAGTNADTLAADAISHAYRLRDGLNEGQKLGLLTLYNQFYKRDFNAMATTLELWTSIYPTDARAWNNLANVANVLGRYDQGVEAGRRAVALHPAFESAYAVLARALLRSGHPDQAEATAALVIKLGLAGDAIHGILLAAAFMQHDDPGVQREIAWARGTPSERILACIEGEIAYARGRIREGDTLFDRSAALSAQQGLPDFAHAYRARLLNDLGLPDRARALLATAKDPDDDDLIFTEAEIGDPSRASKLLADQIRRYPEGTLINSDFGPEVRAAMALRRHDPAAAINALRVAIPYQSRTFDIPYVLARAYLAAGDGARAQAAFQLIIDHQGWYPESPLYALAKLGKARALAMRHEAGAARLAYQDFLSTWASADPDAPLLKAARAEYAKLS